MAYVDGYVIPVPRKNLATYRRVARQCGKIWREYGAIEYRECVADDVDVKYGLPFPRLVKLKKGEVILFSFIVYKSRAQRDRINAQVIADPRLEKMMKPGAMPFDVKRMSFGGFKVIVDA